MTFGDTSSPQTPVPTLQTSGFGFSSPSKPGLPVFGAQSVAGVSSFGATAPFAPSFGTDNTFGANAVPVFGAQSASGVSSFGAAAFGAPKPAVNAFSMGGTAGGTHGSNFHNNSPNSQFLGGQGVRVRVSICFVLFLLLFLLLLFSVWSDPTLTTCFLSER